jgi:hypothetical protein
VSVPALFGLSILMSFVAFGVVTALYIVPRLRVRSRTDALLPLVVPHAFRFVGLSFLVPGVVSASLPATFAVPAAYGDVVAALLAVAASRALFKGAPWAVPLVWIFNVWGAADLLNAFYQGAAAQLDPRMLGAAFYIPTVVVPPALILHGLIFWLLLRHRQ